jgi:hypothetical protein
MKEVTVRNLLLQIHCFSNARHESQLFVKEGIGMGARLLAESRHNCPHVPIDFV